MLANRMLMAGTFFTPTTWNPDDKDASLTLSNGDRTVAGAIADRAGRGVLGLDTTADVGYYVEFLIDTAGFGSVGVATADAPLSGVNIILSPFSWVWVPYNANIYNTGGSAYGTQMFDSERIKMAVKGANIWWGKVGVGWFSGDPETATAPAFSNLSGTIYPMFNNVGTGATQFTANFGQSSFIDTVPAGFEPGWGE